jgi:hypothetical protein
MAFRSALRSLEITSDADSSFRGLYCCPGILKKILTFARDRNGLRSFNIPITSSAELRLLRGVLNFPFLKCLGSARALIIEFAI